MFLHLNGTIHGNRIELEKESGFPAGTPVTVQLEERRLSVEEQRKAIMEACGSWTDDSLDAIFDEIIASRQRNLPRDVNLDASP